MGGGRTAAGPAGDALSVPRIARGAVMRVVGGDAVSEFMQVGLAQQDSDSLPQQGNHGGVLLGHEVSQDLRARGGENPARPDIVLECDGDVVERPEIARAATRSAILR